MPNNKDQSPRFLCADEKFSDPRFIHSLFGLWAGDKFCFFMKRLIFCVVAAGVVLSMSRCATIISGSRQSVTFVAPENTRIYQDGVVIARVPEGATTVETKVKRELSSPLLMARHDDYADTPFTLKSKVNGVVFVNLLLGGLIGAGIDLATGAACKYPNYVEIEMQRE